MSAPALTGLLASLGATPSLAGASAASTSLSSSPSRASARDGARSSFALELQQAQAPAPAPQPRAPAPTPTPPASSGSVPTPRPPNARTDAGTTRAAETSSSPPADTPPAEPEPNEAADGAAERDDIDPRGTAPSAIRARLRATHDAHRAMLTTLTTNKGLAVTDADQSIDAGMRASSRRAKATEDDVKPTATMAPMTPVDPMAPMTAMAPTTSPAPLSVQPSSEGGNTRLGGPTAPLTDPSITPGPSPASMLDPAHTTLLAPADPVAADAQALALPPRAASAAADPGPDPAAAEPGPPPTMPAPAPVETTTLAGALLATQAERLGLPDTPPGGSPAVPSFAADLAPAMAPPAGSPTPAAPATTTERTLPTPVTSPEFVPRLSGELAVLARDGVQEARINVHPVELGPISVQISLDGAAAQVHLAVDNAQTRELLEQAMPSLAAALRENGLTLTGGGVFQQARQNAQDGGRDGRPDTPSGAARSPGLDGPGDADGAAGAAPTRRLRAVGALDVYA